MGDTHNIYIQIILDKRKWAFIFLPQEQIYDEFFSQGDLEKSMGSAPVEMMDRERASIPDLQIQFITNLVIPLFTWVCVLMSFFLMYDWECSILILNNRFIF